MIKPFAFTELVARIRALTRRPEKVLPAELKIADLMLNLNTKKLYRDDKEIGLTLKEFRLLEYFMRRPNEVIKRVDLTDNIWDFDYDSFSNALDVYINRLREKIDKGRNLGLIETVRGTGYKLRAD
jgi:DNA-binding response OmpR family regulator